MYEYNATAGQPTDYLYLNGKLIARYLSGQNPTDLLTDLLGTPVREIDSTGAVAQSFSYRPFGQLYSGPSQQQPGYTGHVLDPESSLNYMQARYQDGGLGQFLSVDPVAPVPGDVLSFNRYDYANNNPVMHTDPDGRQCSQCLYYGDSVDHQASINAAASGIALGSIAGGTSYVGDAMNIQNAIQEPTFSNVAIAAIGVVPEIGGPAVSLVKGMAGGERAGKAFTRAGKLEVKAANAAAHDGKTVCMACGKETIRAEQSRAGVTPPGNETHVDHINPKSKDGNGSPNNGQVLSRDCNLSKGGKYE